MQPQKEQRLERRLAAIFAADVAGYSRLMSQDEAGTLRALAAAREIMDGLIGEHGGRIANTAGDSVLAEFPSAVDAVQCAVAVQERLGQENAGEAGGRLLQFRIGVHLGDVAVRGGDLLGDGVNIAARLEGLAEPGGVCLSEAVHGFVRKALSLTYTDLGEQPVKGFDEPVRAYAVKPAVAVSRQPKSLPLPDKPSIAVLPFTNLSGDPEQDYFCDGLVDEIITALSRFTGLFVIARTSSFTYKGRSADVRQIGRELGVQYVLEGGVRRSCNQIRITGQLIESETGAHVLAERYDGNLENVFELQDKVAQGVAASIEPNIRARLIDRVRGKRTGDLNAYDLYLRALSDSYSLTEQGLRNCELLLREALSIDRNFSEAWALLSDCLSRLYVSGSIRSVDDVARECCEAATRAMDADPNSSTAFATGAWCYAMFGGQHELAMEYASRALHLNPNSFYVRCSVGWASIYSGDAQAAVAQFDAAMRLSPVDVERHRPQVGKATALMQLGDFDGAAEWAKRALAHRPHHVPALRTLAAVLASSGKAGEAASVVRSLISIRPDASVSEILRNPQRFKNPDMLRTFSDGLLKAGLPE